MKINTGTIVLVVDGSKRLLLKNIGDDVYPKLEVIAHQEINNPPNRDQLSDAPGLSFQSMGTGRNAYEKSDPHQEKEDLFAIEAASVLAKAASENDDKIIVVAPPRTLSVLRHHYDRATKNRLLAEIDKDLTKHPVLEITRLIAAHQP